MARTATPEAPVFVDTSALYALLDADDAHHAQAARIWDRLLDTRQLCTHNLIVVESVALAQHRLGMAAARDVHLGLVPVLEMHWVDVSLHDAAVTASLAASQRRVSFVDWTSFELMRRLRLREAFAFDGDFRSHGFATVR